MVKNGCVTDRSVDGRCMLHHILILNIIDLTATDGFFALLVMIDHLQSNICFVDHETSHCLFCILKSKLHPSVQLLECHDLSSPLGVSILHIVKLSA